MDEKQAFAMYLLIAIFIAAIVYLPITIYMNWKHRKEGKSYTIKYLLLLALPIVSVPFLMTDMRWYYKVLFIAIIGLYPTSYVFSIRRVCAASRSAVGLSTVKIKTSQPIEQDAQNHKNESVE